MVKAIWSLGFQGRPVCWAQVDTMIVQAIGLLDDLDKELNTYAMRVREWFGWHFPEMTKIVSDNISYAKVVRAPGPLPGHRGIMHALPCWQTWLRACARFMPESRCCLVPELVDGAL